MSLTHKLSRDVPIVVFEDDHLLVVNKPPGLNTHAPGPYKGEGLFEWLRDREARWQKTSIVHRLDKETSGLIVFPKTDLARRSLTQQFENRAVKKIYLLESSGRLPQPFTIKSKISRSGDKYIEGATGDIAETIFSPIKDNLIKAEPLTGRTHQIRVHAAANGFPVKGDSLYGGEPSSRLHLHAATIEFHHPETEALTRFDTTPEFSTPAFHQLRNLIGPLTNAYRVIQGAADGFPKIYAEMLNEYLLIQSELPAPTLDFPAKGTYYKFHDRNVRQSNPQTSSPQLINGLQAPIELTIQENGINYILKLAEGYSTGLFLDQRDNRRRVLTNYIGASFGELFQQPGAALNVFAYTCGFSLCAALAGFTTTSLDLSKKYLDWGKQNFTANNLNPDEHDFIFGDAFDWLTRLRKKNRSFDLIFLDPPTFSQSKSGLFRASKDYQSLIAAALPLLNSSGILFCSTNAASLDPDKFISSVDVAVQESGRRILASHYAPQPPDFPITRDEPAYLKTLWLRIS